MKKTVDVQFIKFIIFIYPTYVYLVNSFRLRECYKSESLGATS